MHLRASTGCSATSNPLTTALPEVGGRKPAIMRIVVVFPAPLGPRKPSTVPLPASKEMSSTATRAPNFFTRFFMLIMKPPPNRVSVRKR